MSRDGKYSHLGNGWRELMDFLDPQDGSDSIVPPPEPVPARGPTAADIRFHAMQYALDHMRHYTVEDTPVDKLVDNAKEILEFLAPQRVTGPPRMPGHG